MVLTTRSVIYVSVPDRAGRRKILAIHTAKMPLADDVDLEELAARSERFTGADLEDVVRRAGLFALRSSLAATQVTAADFDRAMEETRASVTEEMEREYEQIRAKLKQDAMGAGGIGFHVPALGARAES